MHQGHSTMRTEGFLLHNKIYDKLFKNYQNKRGDIIKILKQKLFLSHFSLEFSSYFLNFTNNLI